MPRKLWGVKLYCPHPTCDKKEIIGAGIYPRVRQVLDVYKRYNLLNTLNAEHAKRWSVGFLPLFDSSLPPPISIPLTPPVYNSLINNTQRYAATLCFVGVAVGLGALHKKRVRQSSFLCTWTLWKRLHVCCKRQKSAMFNTVLWLMAYWSMLSPPVHATTIRYLPKTERWLVKQVRDKRKRYTVSRLIE